MVKEFENYEDMQNFIKERGILKTTHYLVGYDGYDGTYDASYEVGKDREGREWTMTNINDHNPKIY